MANIYNVQRITGVDFAGYYRENGEELSESEAFERFETYLDDDQAGFDFGDNHWDVSDILFKIDPVMYPTKFSDWVDFEGLLDDAPFKCEECDDAITENDDMTNNHLCDDCFDDLVYPPEED